MTSGEPIVARLSEGQLLRRIGRGGEIGHRAGGVLAEIRILEHAMLRERCGPETDDRLDFAISSMLALDARFDEQFCRLDGGRYLVLLPRAEAANAQQRLQGLLDRVAEQTIEIRGDQVSIAATLGWSTYTPDEAPTAIARRVLGVLETDETVVEPKPTAGRFEFGLQLLFSLAVAIVVPYIVYVLVAHLGPDLRVVTVPAMVLSAAFSLASTLRINRSHRSITQQASRDVPYPPATAIVAAHLDRDAVIILGAVKTLLDEQYPGGLHVLVTYDTSTPRSVENELKDLALLNDRLTVVRMPFGLPDHEVVSAALKLVTTEFICVFRGDDVPRQASLARAWNWLSAGRNVVQPRISIRNGAASWTTRLMSVEVQSRRSSFQDGPWAPGHITEMDGDVGYWRGDALREIHESNAPRTAGFDLGPDEELVTTRYAPTTLSALWRDYVLQNRNHSSRAAIIEGPRRSGVQRILQVARRVGAAVSPWVSVHLVPVLLFTIWRREALTEWNWVTILAVVFVGLRLLARAIEVVVALRRSHSSVRRHTSWKLGYAASAMTWFGEFRNAAYRIGQMHLGTPVKPD